MHKCAEIPGDGKIYGKRKCHGYHAKQPKHYPLVRFLAKRHTRDNESYPPPPT